MTFPPCVQGASTDMTLAPDCRKRYPPGMSSCKANYVTICEPLECGGLTPLSFFLSFFSFLSERVRQRKKGPKRCQATALQRLLHVASSGGCTHVFTSCDCISKQYLSAAIGVELEHRLRSKIDVDIRHEKLFLFQLRLCVNPAIGRDYHRSGVLVLGMAQ